MLTLIFRARSSPDLGSNVHRREQNYGFMPRLSASSDVEVEVVDVEVRRGCRRKKFLGRCANLKRALNDHMTAICVGRGVDREYVESSSQALASKVAFSQDIQRNSIEFVCHVLRAPSQSIPSFFPSQQA